MENLEIDGDIIKIYCILIKRLRCAFKIGKRVDPCKDYSDLSPALREVEFTNNL